MRDVAGFTSIDVESVYLGMEVICPDGLGRIAKIIGEGCCTRIQVDAYVNNRSCHWDPINVKVKSPAKFLKSVQKFLENNF